MALDRLTIITSSGLSTVSDYVIDGLRAVGVVTASTVQVGAATTVHTTGVDLGSGNITSHNINSTGIITATGIDVKGVLSYEDVTNVDSVGVITARSGINVTGGLVGIGTIDQNAKLALNPFTTIPNINGTYSNGAYDLDPSYRHSTGGVSIANTENKTYPTDPNFNVNLGLNQNIEVGGTQTINPTTPGGYNFISGIRNFLRKEKGNTQDIERSYYYGINNRFIWNDDNTCKQYLGINDNFDYYGKDANGRIASTFIAKNVTLWPPDGGVQTIQHSVIADGSLTIGGSAGITTVSINRAVGVAPNLALRKGTAGTHDINITDYRVFGTSRYWGMQGSGGISTCNITNYYGLKLEEPQYGPEDIVVTNNFGVYSGWSDSKNYFAGNIGIGITNPTVPLFVQADSPSAIFKLASTTDTSGYHFAFGWADNSLYHRIRTAGGANDGFIIENINSKVSQYFASSGDWSLTANNNPSLTATSTGNVGINKTDPAAALVVYDTAGSLSSTKELTAEFRRADGTYNPRLQIRHSSEGTDLHHTWSTNAGNFTFSNGDAERLRITSDGLVGINTTTPTADLEVYNSNQAVMAVRGDKATLAVLGDDTNSGASETDARIILCSDGTIANTPNALTTSPLNVHGFEIALINNEPGSGLRLHDGTANVERLRITSSGEVNVGGSDMNSTAYAFQVSRDLGTPSASGTALTRFRNANGTYSQDLYLKFNDSKDIIWEGGSGNGGMTWDMGTRGYNWEIGGTNKFSVGPSDVAINGGTDGVLNINTTDGRGSFIRFKENGTTKVWIGSGEGMGAGDQDDACLMSVDNIYFRNSTDSVTTLTVSREGRLTGNKRYPDASGTQRSNPYYPPTNHYQTYSAPSGGSKWMRFAYFASRGRYRITFNSTGGYYSPGSVTFDFSLTWSSPHAYVGNISKLGPQYVSKFRVTTNSSGSAYYGEVYVSVNGNQTGSHIHCTAQVVGTADREFNLYNYGYDLSTLTYTSGDFNI